MRVHDGKDVSPVTNETLRCITRLEIHRPAMRDPDSIEAFVSRAFPSDTKTRRSVRIRMGSSRKKDAISEVRLMPMSYLKA